MKLKVFAVFDSAAEAYLQPFFVQTVGQALRSFSDAVQSEGHAFNKHAADYTLFQIGEYDESVGRLEPLAVLQPLGNAIEYLKKEGV